MTGDPGAHLLSCGPKQRKLLGIHFQGVELETSRNDIKGLLITAYLVESDRKLDLGSEQGNYHSWSHVRSVGFL